MFEKIYRISVLILLIVIVAILGYGQLVSPSTPSGCKNAIAKAEVITNNQSSIITGMQNDFSTAVYDTPSVDNIYKQIFTANEYEFNALQMIALQNSALLEIASNCR
jgi:hypothetical protein